MRLFVLGVGKGGEPEKKLLPKLGETTKAGVGIDGLKLSGRKNCLCPAAPRGVGEISEGEWGDFEGSSSSARAMWARLGGLRGIVQAESHSNRHFQRVIRGFGGESVKHLATMGKKQLRISRENQDHGRRKEG